MKALTLIIQREFYSRVKKKSFILLTIAIPFLFAGLIFLPILLSQVKDSETKKIVIVDRSGIYAPHFKSTEDYKFEIVKENPDESKVKDREEMFGFLDISGNLNQNPRGATFYSEKQPPMDLLMYINNTLTEVSKEYKLNEYTSSVSIDKEVVQSLQELLLSKNDISINTIRWDKDGAEKEMSVELASAIGMVLIMFMYLFILTYGAMVMQGVIEEKTNRIVEVMVSSVKPFNLMMGKIIGIGLTGFVQLFIWICMIALLLGVKEAVFPSLASVSEGTDSFMSYLNILPSVNWFNILFFFLLFFLGGYLIYAAIFAMFGSAVDNPQDTQQFVMPISIIFIFSLYVGLASAQNPDGPLAFWCSMIPLTSPMVMMVRIPAEIPLWETILSLVILYASVLLTIKFAAKIYRVGILMYGKKPNLKELYKWFKYK